MPCLVGIGKLTCLQTLPFFFVSQDRGCQIEELGGLSNLKGKLKIFGLESVRNMEEAKKANLSSKSNIQTLEFHWGNERREGSNNEEVLEGLEPHFNLKDLTIRNFEGERFAPWMMMASTTMIINNLVRIKLVNCFRCKEIPTLGHLPHLKFVEIKGMQNVKCFGREFYGHINDDDAPNTGSSSSNAGGSGSAIAVFPVLKELTLAYMTNLVEWLEVSRPLLTGMVCPSLENLVISDCPNLIVAPSHFPSIKSLQIIGIENSLALAQISSTLTSLTSLHIERVSGSEVNSVLENLLRNNQLLRYLDISRCDGLTYLPNGMNNLVALHTIRVWGCHNLTSMADIITGSRSFTSLVEIYIGDCEKLTCLPSSLQNLVSLEILRVHNCPNLMALPDIHCLTSLRYLSIADCKNLINLPSGLEVCNLESLRIRSCLSLISGPNLWELKCSLRSLILADCGRLTTCWPEGLHLLTGLRLLGIGGFSEELDFFPWPDAAENTTQHLLASLETLKLYGWPKLKSLPEQLQLLTALNHLHIWQFDGLENLPEWLGNLSSLQSLQLEDCEKLMNLPGVEAMRRLTKLHSLTVYNCPVWKERCTKGSGPEWHKIAHIPQIEIHSETIQSRS